MPERSPHRHTAVPRRSAWALASSAIAFASALALVRPAAAQRSVDEKAAAEALFDHAKRLMAQGRYAEACPKFAESQKLDEGIGTLLYMADCYEKNGQSASAWAAFREAAAKAKAAGQVEREKIARDRAGALEASLSKLTITVEPANVLDGVAVVRDGIPVGKALWGTAIPVDPGRHQVEATAPGKKRLSLTVDVAPGGANAQLNVPRLVDAPEEHHGSTAPAPATGDSGRSTRRTLGLVVAGVGVVGVGIGAIFGVQAMSKNDDADAFCRTNDRTRCQAQGVSLGADAESAATISTVAFAAGGVALAGGIALFVTALEPAATKANMALLTTAHPRGGGFAVRGAF